jgi:hypothetical protein
MGSPMIDDRLICEAEKRSALTLFATATRFLCGQEQVGSRIGHVS